VADEFGEKTEAPTPKRRQEARDRGQVAKSQDLAAAMVLLASMIGLQALGPGIWKKLTLITQSCLTGGGATHAGELGGTLGLVARASMIMLLPLLAIVFIAALVAAYWQVGLLLTAHPITPSLSKINPLSGFQRMFSPRTVVTTVINVAKMVLMAAVIYWTIVGGVNQVVFSVNMGHVELYVFAASILLRLGIRLAIVMLILALFDYAYQRYRHEKDLKMSKEEVREELRRMEGDPLMKRRRREVQMKLAMQRIQRDVPKADVILTNPTHYAIALRYDPEAMSAPRVVAKGADWMAYRIRQIAAVAGVPIVERPELVRMMYDLVEVGRDIPERFYEAVAEILAYVYELTGRNLRPEPVPIA
jgi:flagellar biosynthetic protein FlhB